VALVPAVVLGIMASANLSIAQEKKEPPKEQPKAAEKDIVDTIKASATHKTLARLIETAGVTEAWKGKGPFTILAPNDDAFNKLGKEKLESLEKDKAKLTKVLNCCVIEGKHSAADVGKMKTCKTKAGEEFPVTVKDGKTMIGTATITKADQAAGNGVIHTIDTVLMPKESAGGPG